MADFRRVVTALAVLALLVGFTATASAQPYSCQALASGTPLLRAEGITELTGDILIRCTGQPTLEGTSGAIVLFFNANVTARNNEPLLLIDEAEPTSTNVTAGTVFRGAVSGNTITFTAVPVLAPATGLEFRQYRITNIRLNASQIGASASGLANAAIGQISWTPPVTVPLSNPQQTIGFVQTGLTFTLRTAADLTTALGSAGSVLQQCVANLGGSSDVPTVVSFLRYAENFQSAFKVRQPGDGTIGTLDSAPGTATPGAPFLTESGLTAPTIAANLGWADAGTRVRRCSPTSPPAPQFASRCGT